jgi:hypothetical protein
MKRRRLGFNDIHQKEMFDNDYYKNLDNGLVGKFNIQASGIAGEMVYTTEWKDGYVFNRMPFYEMDTTNIERIGQNFDI